MSLHDGIKSTRITGYSRHCLIERISRTGVLRVHFNMTEISDPVEIKGMVDLLHHKIQVSCFDECMPSVAVAPDIPGQGFFSICPLDIKEIIKLVVDDPVICCSGPVILKLIKTQVYPPPKR